MRQDIVLVSNASMDIYPNNRLSDFRVRLPQPLVFDSSYVVAVTRVSFTKSYFNYTHETGDKKAWVILSDTRAQYVPDNESMSRCDVLVFFLAGYYTPETFIEMVNLKLREIKIDGTDEKQSDVKYSLKNGFLETTPGTFVDDEGDVHRFEVQFDPDTRAILGIDKAPEIVRPVFLNQGWTDLFVYSDLVYPSVVGDQACELLCIVDGQTEKRYGAHCVEVFDDPWYHPLAKHNFQEIRIYIRADTGLAPNFRFGRVNLRLSFRKKDDI